MALYVQSFPEDDQAMLDSCAFRALPGDGCIYKDITELDGVSEERVTRPFWNHSIHWTSPYSSDLDPDTPRIRGKDIIAFKDIWIRNSFRGCGFARHLCGYLEPTRWTTDEGRHTTTLLSYRTFKLCLSAETTNMEAV